MELQERLDSSGRSRVLHPPAQCAQRLPARARKEGGQPRVDVGQPAAADGGPGSDHAEHGEAGADAGGQRKVRGPLQECNVMYTQGMRLKKLHRPIEFEQEPWLEPYIRMNTEFR